MVKERGSKSGAKSHDPCCFPTMQASWRRTPRLDARFSRTSKNLGSCPDSVRLSAQASYATCAKSVDWLGELTKIHKRRE